MEIKLKQFEGPLELLLKLIEENRLDITEIALAEVTDQYLCYLADQETSIVHLADFLLIASRLLLIKSKTLLPFLSLSTEEEQEIKELRFSLEEYRRYKKQSKLIEKLWQQPKYIFSRLLWQGRPQYFYPPERLELQELSKVFAQTLLSWQRWIIPKEEQFIEQSISIEEKIQDILKRIQGHACISLHSLGYQKKMDLILCFLALLFLFKQKLVELEQYSYRDDIVIKKTAV